METVDELSAKLAQLDNQYKQIMDTDWWLMSIVITIEVTAIPLIILLVFAIIKNKDKRTNHRLDQLKDNTKPLFPEPSRETVKLISEHWSGKISGLDRVFRSQNDDKEWQIEKTRV